MLAEVVALLAPALQTPLTDQGLQRECVLVDCTLGLGGHARAYSPPAPKHS
jgi:16S rRNA C1402 N4-methylase RsmH